MSGAMVQHVSGVTGALDDASGQIAQVGACVMRTGQQIQSAVSALFGDMMSAGGNAGAFAGPAATAAANAIAPLRSQMDECAHAAGHVSTALSVCSSHIFTAAERADHAGIGEEVLAWIVDSLDLAEVMSVDMSAQIPIMLRQFPNLPFSLPANVGDWLLSKVLPDWARETHEATNDCVRALHGITDGLADARRLAPAPSSTVAGITNTITAQAQGDYIAGIALELSGCLVPGYNPSLGHVSFCVFNDACLKKLESTHPGWTAIINATLARDTSDWSKTDVECVAFVDIVYAIAHQFPMAQPYATGDGGAKEFWLDWVQNRELDHLPGWTSIKNDGKGMPQPGDIMVFSDGDTPGHVAVVTRIDTSVKPARVYFASSNTSMQEQYFIIDEKTHIVEWTQPGPNNYSLEHYQVLGFIRQVQQTGP